MDGNIATDRIYGFNCKTVISETQLTVHPSFGHVIFTSAMTETSMKTTIKYCCE